METTLFHPLPGMRCCDNCEPRLFETEQISIDKTSALKRGKKRKLPQALADAIRNDLSQWREKELLDKFYGGTSIIAGSTLLSDDVIEKLATCGNKWRQAKSLHSMHVGRSDSTQARALPQSTASCSYSV